MHNTHTPTQLCQPGRDGSWTPLEAWDPAPSQYLALQTHKHLHRQEDLTVLVAPVASKVLDSIHNSSGSQELHGRGRVHCLPTCSSRGAVSPQRRVKQNTKAQEGRGGGSQAFGEAGALFLRARARCFQKPFCPERPSRLWFSTRISLSPGWPGLHEALSQNKNLTIPIKIPPLLP